MPFFGQAPLGPNEQLKLIQMRATSVNAQKQFQHALWVFQSNLGQPTAGAPAPNAAAKGALMTAIKANTNEVGLIFETAGVFSGLAQFSLNTAINFPGFNGFASKAGMISEIATAGAGAAGLITSSTNNTKGATVSTALAALLSGLGSMSSKNGQSSSLQTAFNELNQATASVAVLKYMQQDYNIVGPDRDHIVAIVNALTPTLQKIPADPTQTDDSDAASIANQYINLIKIVDAWYSVDLASLQAALGTQVNPDSCKGGASPVTLPNTPNYSASTIQEFCQLITNVDAAQSTWKSSSAAFDNATTQAQTYLVAVQ